MNSEIDNKGQSVDQQSGVGEQVGTAQNVKSDPNIAEPNHQVKNSLEKYCEENPSAAECLIYDE